MRCSIAAAYVANEANNTVAGFPALTPAELPGLRIAGADEDRPLRGLWQFGGVWLRTDVDYKTVVAKCFHEDAL